MAPKAKRACVVSHSHYFPDSPVRTLQSCPDIWVSAEGLSVKDHLRLIRCSCPWELLRGWISTCSCPSWMRPTCPERGKQLSVILIHICPRPQSQRVERPPSYGLLPLPGLFLCSLHQFTESKNELLHDLKHLTQQLCWGSGDRRRVWGGMRQQHPFSGLTFKDILL